MDVICRCAACSTQFKVDAKYAGKKAKCPKCAALMIVPAAGQSGAMSNTMPIASNTASQENLSPPKDDLKKARFTESQHTNASVTAPDLSHVQQPPAKATGKPAANTTPSFAGLGNAPAPAAAAPTLVPLKPSERLLHKNAASKNTTVNSDIGFETGPTTSSATSTQKPRKASGKKISPITWVVGGGVAALVGVVGIIASMIMMSAKAPALVIKWSEGDRKDVSLMIDKKKVELPKTGPVKIPLKTGSHNIVIKRRGYDQIDHGFSLKNGEEYDYRPEWKKADLAVERPPSQNVAKTGTELGGAFTSNPNMGANNSGAASSTGPVGFESWEQILETAKRTAKDQKKDLFVVFSGSDWAQPSIRMANEIFSNYKFSEFAKQRFVLVVIDSPRTRVGFDLLTDQSQNQFLVRQFGIEHVPTIFLMDAYGKPYAVHRETKLNVDEYINELKLQLTNHLQRDTLIAKMTQAQLPDDRLAVAEETFDLLRKQTLPHAEGGRRETDQVLENSRDLGLARFYPELLASYLKIARKADDKNAKGKLERFFEADWRTRLGKETEDRAKESILKELDEFSATYTFQDQDRAASLFLLAALSMEKSQNEKQVFHYLERAIQYKPKDKSLSDSLTAIGKFLKSKDQLSTGTGFIVDARGYVMTNHHVIDGPGKVVIRRPDNNQEIPAEVVAQDAARDIALLKVDPSQFATWKPIAVSTTPVERGSKVAMFGYPLGDTVGAGIKLTTGGVSSVPEESNDNMIVIDGRVNPGNSGGPLCNDLGNVVGMITAKSHAGSGLDSYGMALPATDLHSFLEKNLPDYASATVNNSGEAMQWNMVDRIVSPAVLMIIKVKK